MKELKLFLSSFETFVENSVENNDNEYKILSDSMRYSLLAGGKRIRPFLLTQFFKVCGGEEKLAYNFALALEMIHTYSLIHDDLPCMDNDDFRRGKPSNHKQFGEDIALLAGDALLTEAFCVASKTVGINSEAVVKAIKLLSHYAGYRGMVGGQVIDLQSEGKEVDLATIEKLNLLKTGALLKAACEIGCVLANASEEKIKAAGEYGEKIGLAFQLIDDILDATADEKLLGKPVGSDQKNNKSTFVSLKGIDYCKGKAEELTNQAISALSVFGDNTEVLKETAIMLTLRKY